MIDDCPKEKVREVPASEILDKILKGEDVEYNCVIVKGDLDLSKLDLPTQHIERTDAQKKGWNLPEEAKVVKSEIKITNSTINGIIKFDNAIFQKEIEFRGAQFSGDALFSDAQFSGSTNFLGAQFSGSALFGGAKFIEDALFSDAQFSGDAHFSEAQFSGYANFFLGAQFNGSASFRGAQFSEFADFGYAQFSGSTNFLGAQFNGSAGFWRAQFSISAYFSEAKFNGDAFFWGAQFSGSANFSGAKFNGDLTFREATFSSLADQGKACRKTKMVQAKIGNRDEEEYHFYREMEAKRRLHGLFEEEEFPVKAQSLKAENLLIVKNFLWYDVFEYVFVQKIFGYGVHPWWLIAWWIAIVTLFAVTYWAGKGIGGAMTLFDCFKISFATAIAPGYIAVIFNPASTGYRIAPPYQAVAILETIIGTFLWAGFIATFAKRYMR